MAIALDASTSGGGDNLTFAHTCTGSNLILFVGGAADYQADRVTGITYGGVAMTQVNKGQLDGDRWQYLYYLVNPPTGANNVVVSGPTGGFYKFSAISYTGASQTGVPDSSALNMPVPASTTYAISTTSIADNCWAVAIIRANSGGAKTAGANTTMRANNADTAFFDNNAAKTPAGSITLNVSCTNSNWGGNVATFAPFVAASGPANMKSYNTNLKANIKSIDTNLIANIKSFDTNV